MSFFTRFRRAFFGDDDDDENRKSLPGGFHLDWLLTPTASSGATVNASTAMQVPAVHAAVTILSNSVGTLPAEIYVCRDGSKEVFESHPAYALVNARANAWQSAFAFRRLLTTDALLHGNGFALANRNSQGDVVELVRLDPYAVTIDVDEITLEPRYRVALADGGELVRDYRDVFHVAAPTKDVTGVVGISPVQLCREAIGLSLTMEKTAANTYRNHACPSGILRFPETLGDEAQARLRDSWHTAFNGENAGKTAILEQGAEYSVIQQKFADQQFLENRKFQILEICRAFNVPPNLVFDFDRATWANAAESNRFFLEYSLLPWLREFEDAYHRVLLGDDDLCRVTVEFNVDDFTRSDLATRAAAYAQLRSSGIMTANEARNRENLPEHPQGNDLTNPYVATDTRNTGDSNDE